MDIKFKNMSINSLLIKVRDKNPLWILPQFQRDETWDDKNKSKLLEHIQNKIPIGPLTIVKKDDKHIIIDGQQRLTTLKDRKAELSNEDLKEYKIPVLTWIETPQDKVSLADCFVAMNQQGTKLDNDDIMLSLLSEVKINKPKWLDESEYLKDIKSLYATKNNKLSFEFINTKKISITEMLWLIAKTLSGKIIKDQKLDALSNRYSKIFAALSTKKGVVSAKRKLIITRRFLSLIFAKQLNETEFYLKQKQYFKKLEEDISQIFSNKEKFQIFCLRLNNVLINSQNKFAFILDIPIKQTSATRAEISSLYSKDYIPLYMFHFIKINSDYIIGKKTNEKYTFKPSWIDLIYFSVSKPISAGGYKKWLEIIYHTPNDLRFTYSEENAKALTTNIINNARANGANFSEFTKLVCLWLASKNVKFRRNSKKDSLEYYEFDHIVSKDSLKKIAPGQYSVLANCDLLTKIHNSKKKEFLTLQYSRFSLIHPNKEYKNEQLKKFMHKWRKNNTVVLDEYHKFLNDRREFLEKRILNEIQLIHTK